MKLKTTLIMGALASVGLSACTSMGSINENTAVRKDIHYLAEKRQAEPTVIAQPKSRVIETETAYIPLAPRKNDGDWLKGRKVSLQMGEGPTPLPEVLRILAKQGINISSELPLGKFSYAGFSLKDADAEAALRTVLSGVGLDYDLDASRRLVVIKPVGSRTWYLNLGNRHSTYASGTSADTGKQNQQNSGSANGTSVISNSPAAQGSGKSTIQSADDFWASLKTELDARLKIMIPEVTKAAAAGGVTAGVAPAPGYYNPYGNVPVLNGLQMTAMGGVPGAVPQGAGVPTPMGTQPSGGTMVAQPTSITTAGGVLSSDAINYVSKTVGSYSVNPETGAISVQAPQWILKELDTYFKQVQAMYNTHLSFQGELIMLTTENSRSEGLDISAFAKFANQKYGLAYSNNALGGVTVSFPTDSQIPSIVAGQTTQAGPLLGVVSAAEGLSMFNAYLTSLGKVSTLQKPVLNTSSGVPVDYRQTLTRYFNTVSQQAVGSSTGSAAVGTQNTLIAKDFGTILRINPRVDVATGLIRAQIELVQTSQAGTQIVPQSLSSGNGVQQVNSPLPIVSEIAYSGEALLKDGDLIVMGGQVEDGDTVDRNGVTELMDSQAVGGAFGVSKKTTHKNVFYFALRVSVTKR